MIRETDHLQPAFLLLAPKRIPDLRLFRRNVILVAVGDRKVRAGIKGQADLYGFWRGGRAIEIELKGARTIQTPEQIAWAAFCREWGVQHVTLRALKTETVDETVERWCAEVEKLRPADERAAVVQWLRDVASFAEGHSAIDPGEEGLDGRELARRIECGDHLKRR